ncbi:gastrula zinc finger protein XlCGF7.1-like [Trichogramma pretiosum]|uniref:gastrula zinc finger protein XlCGF7.1-like n=1 Tax=Trichogramma pretiosum TaxID=7493 RepID=UPI0006C9C3A8|nr:gastrula zinc finger protein XlCGF7.1-like [Trichogramma pretiosum]
MDAMGDSINRLFTCEFCHKSFTEIGLKRHMDSFIHHPRLNHSPRDSEILDYVLNLEDYWEHNQFCECEICRQSFGLQSELKHHKDTDHIQSSHLNLTEHIISVQNKEKPIVCRLCGQSIGQQGNLQRHIDTVHKKIKPYKCDMCPLSFSRKDNLQNHKQRIHKQDPFECHICYKSFEYKKDYLTHLREVHSNCQRKRPVKSKLNEKKTFKCDKCDRSFVGKKYLDDHIRMRHKIFECKACHKSFGENNKLKRHIIIEHRSGKFYECKHCSQVFERKANFNLHTKKVHLKPV